MHVTEFTCPFDIRLCPSTVCLHVMQAGDAQTLLSHYLPSSLLSSTQLGCHYVRVKRARRLYTIHDVLIQDNLRVATITEDTGHFADITIPSEVWQCRITFT